jgi:RHS repeat-associated protein
MEESVSNSYYYTGQERDEAPSGLYNLRARYYAPGIGRFTQEDPVFGMAVGLTGSANCSSNNSIEVANGFDLFSNPTFRRELMQIYVTVPQNLNSYQYAHTSSVSIAGESQLNPFHFIGVGKQIIMCYKYKILCVYNGLECSRKLQKELDCMTLEQQTEWAQGIMKDGKDIISPADRAAWIAAALKKECWDKEPACQEKVHWCTQFGASP